MSDDAVPNRFGSAAGFILGSRDERTLGLFCPKCAADRMFAVGSEGDEISYVETVRANAARSRCSACGAAPLVLEAQELLRPHALLAFMGKVLQMAEREAKRTALVDQEGRPLSRET